ncbi:MAG: ABC transporter ATP-binding protein [bacterium]
MLINKTHPLLEFKNVTVLKGAEHKKVLDSISLTIHAGENIAILGPNGAGKSSLIKTITREYYPIPDGAEVISRIWGQEVWNVFDLRYLLGIVSNDLQYTCTREITGYEIILSGFFSSIGLYQERISKTMKQKADQVLAFLEIEHLQDKVMTEMSSGEARRFLIGRALVHDPKALILDEPTNSLDIHAVHRFRNILRKIARSGTSIILITQHLQDIVPEISRVVLMKQSRIFMDGKKEEILTSRNIGKLYDIAVQIKENNGYYYVVGY